MTTPPALPPIAPPVVAVVLAGGSGTRLWPLSRQMFPKQFLSLDGDKSLLQATVDRLAPLVPRADVWVVTSANLATGAGWADVQGLNLVLEPAARNTAPAIGLMAALMQDFGPSPDPILLILPADHVIGDVEAFHNALDVAFAAAAEGHIVTFGITPTHAETGFGYIKASGDGPVRPVEAFVEKPNLETARAYLLDGRYTWNSGMFVAKASVLWAAIKAHAPALFAGLATMQAEWRAGARWQDVVAARFGDLPSESIDYAVMEKADNVVVVPCSIGWSDVGSWEAVYDMSPKDANGNVLKAPVLALDSARCLVMGDGRLAALIGVDDLCIVDTPDALLVAHRSQSQRVKHVVDALKQQGGETHIFHRTVRRPWGSFTILDDKASGYKLKRIDVRPGGRLSLQSHAHRSEHWVVVQGMATVTNGDTVQALTVGQSTYIPQGTRHRLENLGDVPLQIVEVQVGDYLGEDDIVRYDDVYGR